MDIDELELERELYSDIDDSCEEAGDTPGEGKEGPHRRSRYSFAILFSFHVHH